MRHGKIALASDGNAVILDGKHTFAALAELQKTYDALVAAEAATADDDEATLATVGTADPADAGTVVAEEVAWSHVLIAARW